MHSFLFHDYDPISCIIPLIRTSLVDSIKLLRSPCFYSISNCGKYSSFYWDKAGQSVQSKNAASLEQGEFTVR